MQEQVRQIEPNEKKTWETPDFETASITFDTAETGGSGADGGIFSAIG